MEFNKDTKIGELLEKAPEKADILLEAGMHCLGCPASQAETLEEACMVHGIDVEEVLKELNEKYDGKHIVLVTHSLCARIMLLSFLDSSVQNIYRINQGNTALNIIELRDYGPVVMKMNDTTHIINDKKIENSALE